MCGPSSRRATDRCRPRNPSSPASTARRYTAPAPRRPAPRSSRCGSGSSSRAPRYSRRRAAAAGCRRAGRRRGGTAVHRRQVGVGGVRRVIGGGGRRRIGLRWAAPVANRRPRPGAAGRKADRACHDRLRGERGTRFNSRDDNSSAARGRRGNSSNSAPAGSRPAAPAPPRIRPACWPGQAPAPGAFHGGRVSVGARRSPLGGAASVPDMRGMRGVGRVSMFVAPASVRRASGAGFALTGIRPSSPKDVRRCNRSETAFA